MNAVQQSLRGFAITLAIVWTLLCIAALLYSQGIRNPAAIEAAIRQFAVDRGTAGRDNEYGFGLVDARATLRGLGIAR